MDQIVVKSALRPNEEGEHRVAFWERHKAHPDGEVWIADTAEHIVAETPEVLQAIRDQKLLRVEGRKPEDLRPAAPAPEEPKAEAPEPEEPAKAKESARR